MSKLNTKDLLSSSEFLGLDKLPIEIKAVVRGIDKREKEQSASLDEENGSLTKGLLFNMLHQCSKNIA
tara:strand:- start:16933 stop:17136 length:204 start_codon:yes stop_codon:yes gene_type:complete